MMTSPSKKQPNWRELKGSYKLSDLRSKAAYHAGRNQELDATRLRVLVAMRYHQERLAVLEREYANLMREYNANIDQYLNHYEQFEQCEAELRAAASHAEGF